MGIENLNPKEFQAIKNLEQILGTEIPRLEYPIRSEKDLGFNTFGVYCEDGVVKEISLRRETHDYNSTTSSNNSLNNSSGKNSERSSGWVIHIEEQQSSFTEPLFELEHIRLLDF